MCTYFFFHAFQRALKECVWNGLLSSKALCDSKTRPLFQEKGGCNQSGKVSVTKSWSINVKHVTKIVSRLQESWPCLPRTFCSDRHLRNKFLNESAKLEPCLLARKTLIPTLKKVLADWEKWMAPWLSHSMRVSFSTLSSALKIHLCNSKTLKVLHVDRV